MLRKFTKKRVYLALTAVTALALAAGAFAYFTSTGSGTGSATVGSASSWTVTPGSETGTMYPGAGSSVIPFTVTNAGSGYQNLAGETTAVVADGSGDIEQGGTSKSGCLASWFTSSVTTPVTGDLAGNATSGTGQVTVTMSDTGDQDPCQGVTPDITISAK